MRRNALADEPHQRVSGDEDAQWIATLINPVDHRLYDVVVFDGSTYLVAPMPNELYKDPDLAFYSFGDGYFGDDQHLPIDGDEVEFTRSHTPSGVVVRKKALGLLLYSGLSLAAVVLRGTEGIFSRAGDRSQSAGDWWAEQVRRGYASEAGGYVSGYGSIELDAETVIRDMVDLDAEASSGMFGEEFEEATNVEFSEVDPSYITINLYVEGEGLLYTILPAVNVAAAKMGIAWDDEDSQLDAIMSEEADIPEEILVELDLSTVGDPQLLLNVWNKVCQSDVSEAQRRKLISTMPAEIVQHPELLEKVCGQRTLPFPSFEEAQEVAANPAKKVKHSDDWEEYFGYSLLQVQEDGPQLRENKKLKLTSVERYRASAAQQRRFGGRAITKFLVHSGPDHPSFYAWGYGPTPGQRKTNAREAAEVAIAQGGVQPYQEVNRLSRL